ncbi:Phenylacetate CoA ligase [sediment metagenome]|uniref:Phenylacetate CoA ligase n=1 Tax=sediment metagenome TaxID=749907 RepID=D9PF02_9ZZZZ
MIWNEKFECLPLKDLKNIQSERLVKTVEYVYKNSNFYKTNLEKHGITPKDIKNIDDIKKLPMTEKENLRDNYPFGLFSMPLDKIAEIHVSSGTTGNPTVVGYSKEDVELWAEVMARTLCCAGGKPGDMVQVSYGYGLFTGGLGVHYGALKAGMTIIPCSSGQTQRQLKIMQDFKPRILTCTPSYALFMVDDAKEMKIDCKKSSWEIGLFGAEPWSNAMRKEIEDIWNISATDIYGLSEIIGPGVAQECTFKDGLHLYSDVFYPEVLDAKTEKDTKEGTPGVLVITHLTKTGMPLIRYKTRDIVTIRYEKCKCGRTSPRISKVLGRTDDMIIVRGINVFPSQIEHVLLTIEETQPHYQLIVDREEGGLDTLEVLVEIKEEFFSDEVKQLNKISEKIKRQIESVLGVGVKVHLVEPKTVARFEGKAKRVIDKRKL